MLQFCQNSELKGNELIVSIILPCYNVEKYIKICLDSIFTQYLPQNQYEVICVNDCSTDNTELIIREYQSNHNNLILINHTINKKQGEARNSGLMNAKGVYVWFIDPDDFISNNCLTEIVKLLEVFSPDIFQFNSYKVDKYGSRIGNVYASFIDDNVLIDSSEYFKKNKLLKFPVHTWSKIFRAEFLINSKISYSRLDRGEDDIHSLEAYSIAKRIFFKNKCYYNYRQTPNSITNAPLLTAKRIFEQTFVLGNEIIKISDSNRIKDSSVKRILYEGGVWRVNQFLRPLMKMSNIERFNFFRIFKSKTMYSLNKDKLNLINRMVMKYSYLSHTLFFFTSLYFRLFKESRSSHL